MFWGARGSPDFEQTIGFHSVVLVAPVNGLQELREDRGEFDE